MGRRIRFGFLILLGMGLAGVLQAETVVLHLTNGDRITGEIIVQNREEIALRTAWEEMVVIPRNQIGRIQPLEAVSPAAETFPRPADEEPAPPPASPEKAPQEKSPEQESREIKPAVPPSEEETVPAATPQPAPEPSAFREFLSYWSGEVRIGTDLGFGTKRRELYSGTVETTYARERWENTLFYNATYGTSDEEVSANQMEGRMETDFELGKRWFADGILSVGYDDVREIDLQYQVSPGIGYHLIQKSRLITDLVIGGSFQRQNFKDHRDQTRYSLRISEKVEWQLNDKLELEEKVDFYPDIEDFGEYNLRLEANLQYTLKEYVTLNLTVIDIYDSQVPPGVNNNDLQLRSSVGVAF